jgi:type IV pilus assembly protein PilN
MIKINLLPVRVSKKKETAKQQLLIFILILLIMIAVGGAVYSVQVMKIKTANEDIDRSNKEIQRLKTVIGEIDNIKKLQDEVKKKLDILNQLRKEKTGPAVRMAKLSDATPEKLWLTRYSESGDSISLSGIAFNEDLIAAFMRNLVSSDEFTNVELQVSEQLEFSGIKGKRFDISCSLKAKK